MTPRVGLVLGAGGITGHAFHAGVLRALHEVTAWDPRRAEVIVGTSAGSVVGASLRAGLAPVDLHARICDQALTPEGESLIAHLPDRGDEGFPVVDRRFRPVPAAPSLLARLGLRPWRARPGLFLAALLPEGRFDSQSIADDVDALLANDPSPGLWTTTVRLRDGRRVTFGRPGESTPRRWTRGQAVAASCAIPGFFAPVAIGGTRFVDGGSHSPTNADLLVAEDLDLALISSPMSSVRGTGFRTLDAPVRVGHRLRLAVEVAALRRRGTPVVVFQPTGDDLSVMGTNAMDPSRRRRVAERAYRSALERCEREGLLSPLSALPA